jgi:hypothetical protein
MRRNLMQEGLEQFCKQMLLHNAPLKFQPSEPTMGRFFPTDCKQSESENGDLFVRFTGIGYAFTNVTKKLTFNLSGAVQYNQDFQIADEACEIYAYFRPRQIASSDFKVNKIEQPAASYFSKLTPMGDDFGKQLLSGKLREGFTVIQLEDGSQEFSLGVLALGSKPQKPVQVHGEGRIGYENSRVEIHQNQRDFVGPIEVSESGRAIYLTAQVDGGVPVDVFVMPQRDANIALGQYLEVPQIQAFTAPPLWSDVIPAQMPGFRRNIPVPPGLYYVIFDHSAAAGTVAPPQNVLDDRAALIEYAVQVGDAP